MPCRPCPDTPTTVPSAPPSLLPCQIVEGDLWFAEEPDALERAKAWCHTCPVRVTCLRDALARRERWGVWGGEILDRGAVLPRKRRRGRPRKDETAARDELAG